MIKIASVCIYLGFVWAICSCTKRYESPSARTIAIDSSIAISMEISGLLTDRCIPYCWPRDFTKKMPSKQYFVYVWKNTYSREKKGVNKFEETKRYFPEVGTSFYDLIDYASVLTIQEISIKDIRPLTNKRIKFGLINGLKGKLNDNELGYIQLSPVIVNRSGDKGVFFYKLIGEFHSSWLICIRKVKGKWALVSKSRLSIS